MKAIVCVKQVPDTSGKVSVKPDGTLDRASMATITNPDDLNALEAALKLKDATGCKVVVMDANDIGREILGRSDESIEIDFCKSVFEDNPLGQSSQQTPIALVRKAENAADDVLPEDPEE